jgi:hypothetical protein
MKKGGYLLKKLCWKCLKLGLLIFVILASALAIYCSYKGEEFDPINEIQRLKIENRRDDALDLYLLFRGSNYEDLKELAELGKGLEYTTSEKIKSFAWNGAVKGEVYDSYSGFGAISADLCVVGDLRDLGIQSWKYLTDDTGFDEMIFILSAAGIGLSGTPYLNGTNALAKNTIKYLKKIPASLNKGMLKKFLSGKMSHEQCGKIWELLKKTDGLSREPYPAYPI